MIRAFSGLKTSYQLNQLIPLITYFGCRRQYKIMSDEIDKSQYILPQDQPVVVLESSAAFSGLTPKERLYAHYLSEAAWVGGLITLLQTSPESGPIFVFLHQLFSGEKPSQLKEKALNAGFTEDEVTALLVYTCGVFSNAGNYKGFGDTKFVPNIDASRLEELLKLSSSWSQIEILWKEFKFQMFELKKGRTCLGYSPQGCTTYLSANCGPEDNERVQNWLKKHQIECYNTRCFKTENDGQVEYEIRLASEEIGELLRESEDKYSYRLTKGDYSPLMGQVAQYLEKAVPQAANPTEAEMLQAYIRSFTTGSLQDHKDGSRLWIKNKGPAVETYIGFIETYRDPAGVRGEFEGFVAAVNREMSAKFGALVESAEDMLKLLPWPRGFEKDTFLRPDFTSLDVLTFAGSGIPAGINIPNYDEIRQSEGFKNVSLGNVIPASYQSSNTPFLNESDAELLQRCRIPAFELQVGLHELLGHGSGKLLRREKDGSLNYLPSLLNPLTGKPPTSCYEPGDTYDSRFGSMSSAYEECRAEAVGLYLSLEQSILKIFGHEGSRAEEITYANWLSMVWAGAGRALEMWEPGRGWLQAHSQARFVLAQVLIQAGVATVTQPKPEDLLITVDKNALRGPGRNAIGHFLLQLQVYKSTGDFESAQQLFNHYSEVNEQWLAWRSIILANKQPRKMFVQPNTELVGNDVKMKSYEGSLNGLIQSWTERFKDPELLYSSLLKLAKADAHHFIS